MNPLVQQLLASSEFELVLGKVEDRARDAVISETKKNAAMLIALSLAGGCIGGYLFKGKTGAIAAGFVAYWAANRLINPAAVDVAMANGSDQPISGYRWSA